MEIHMSHCEKCMYRMDIMPPPVVSLYLKMCLCSIERVVTFDGQNKKTERSIATLEKRGFILTTEVSNDVIEIKVKGHEIDVIDEAEMHYFCAFPDIHL